MGLLDEFSEFVKTPGGQGLLSAAFGGMAGAQKGAPLNSIGRAGMAGMMGYGGALDRQEQTAQAAQMGKYRDMQQTQMQMQIEAAKRKATEEQGQAEWKKGLPALLNPTYGAGDEGPTMTQPDPAALNNYLMQPNSPFADKMLEQKLFTKPEAFTLGEGQVRYSGNQVVATGPAKKLEDDAFTKTMRAAGIDPASLRGQSLYSDYLRKQSTHQPSTVVNTGDSLGLKPKDRFDMEDKMRNDYTAATKNDSEIISTAQDLKSILQQGGALKDQAAIYKFAKSLDPQGAVREADYAAIVKTAGGLDYVTSLVNKALTGEQLSAKQRIEMTSLMDSMAGVAQKRVGKVQGRYAKNATMYNLKPENIFQQQTDSGDGWGIETPRGK